MQSSFENGGCSHYSVQIGCLESLFHVLTHGNIYQSLLFFLTKFIFPIRELKVSTGQVAWLSSWVLGGRLLGEDALLVQPAWPCAGLV